ncbi:LCP family protein, partial [Streptomyces sp. ZG43]
LGRGLRGAAGDEERALTVPLRSEGEVPGAGDVVVWDRRRAGELFVALREDRPIPTSDLK